MSILTLTTPDGERLEAILDKADEPRGVVVICHPHPQHGGTMRAPILGAIAKHAVAEGFSALRFNFRGVGDSTGTHGLGREELNDVSAAITYAANNCHKTVGIVGWSFGAAVALRWQAIAGSSMSYVGIAPPVTSYLTPDLPDSETLVAAKRAFIIGERDQFIDADELERYADSISAETIRYPGTDHFFVLRHKRLAEDVVRLIGGPTD